MAYIEECLEKFNLLPAEAQDILGGSKALEKMNFIEREFGVDVKFLVVLVAISELKVADIPEYLMKKYKIDKNKAQKITNYLIYSLFIPLVQMYQDEEMLEIYKEELKDILTTRILPILKLDNLEAAQLFNEKLNYIIIYEGLEFIDKTIDLLIKNQEQLSDKQFIVDNQPQRSTIGNWLQYFITEVRDKKLDALTISEFMTDNVNVKVLTADEKKVIWRLIKFYQNLKLLPDKTPELIAGVWNIFPIELLETEKKQSQGERDKSSVVVSKKIDDLTDNLLKSYNLQNIKWTIVEKRLSKFAKIYSQIKKFQQQFHQAINSRNKEDIIAALMVLAKQGQLDEIFERDEKIKEIFKAHLAKKFSDKLASNMENNLRAPVYLSYFLQHLLKDILKLDENESAVLAIKLVNELKRAGDKQYIAIAYGDLETGTFKWKTIIEKADKLELAED